MLTSILLAATVTTAIPTTEWRYEHQVSSFTNEQQITLEGVNPDKSEMLLQCNNKRFEVSIFVPQANALETTFFAKVDNNLGIKLFASSLGNKVKAYRRGVWGSWPTVINEMKHGNKVTFLLKDEGSPTIVEFDLFNNQHNIRSVMEHCGNF